MTSIVGSWNMRVSWSFGPGAGQVQKVPSPITFNADGTWSPVGGRWVQVGDHVFWNHPIRPGLVYAANTQFASMTGIMGYLRGDNRGSFYALRVGVPGSPEAVTSSSDGVPENNRDPLLGPVIDSLLGSVA